MYILKWFSDYPSSYLLSYHIHYLIIIWSLVVVAAGKAVYFRHPSPQPHFPVPPEWSRGISRSDKEYNLSSGFWVSSQLGIPKTLFFYSVPFELLAISLRLNLDTLQIELSLSTCICNLTLSVTTQISWPQVRSWNADSLINQKRCLLAQFSLYSQSRTMALLQLMFDKFASPTRAPPFHHSTVIIF